MASIAIPLIAGLAGGLINRPSTQKSTTNSTSNTDQTQNSAYNNSSMPVYDPYQLQMKNYLLSQFYNQSNPAAIHDIVNASINGGTNAINQSAAPNTQALQNVLAQRGLSYSGTAGTALGQQEAGRIGQITNLQAQRPLMQQQLQQGALTSFSDFLSRLPVGTQNTGTGYQNMQGTTTGNSTTVGQTPGNILGGAVAGFGAGLADSYGKGAFGGQKNPESA